MKQVEQDKPKRVVKRGMPGSYYAALGKRQTDGVWRELVPRLTPEEREAQKASLRRKAMIAAAVKKVQG